MSVKQTDSPDQTTALAPGAGVATKKELPPVKLRSAHDYSLVTRALTDRQDTMKALAKKAREEGYETEARAIEADAAAIEHEILPQVRSQRELTLVDDAQLEAQIASMIQILVFRAFDGLGDPKINITATGYTNRRDRLVKVLAERIAQFAHELAHRSYDHGFQVRTMDAATLASCVVNALHPGAGVAD